MTELQTALVAKIETEMKFTTASWNGKFLNCVRNVLDVKGKAKPQKFSFVFDEAEICQGAALVRASCKGAYSESFAKDAFAIIVAFDEAHKNTMV